MRRCANQNARNNRALCKTVSPAHAAQINSRLDSKLEHSEVKCCGVARWPELSCTCSDGCCWPQRWRSMGARRRGSWSLSRCSLAAGTHTAQPGYLMSPEACGRGLLFVIQIIGRSSAPSSIPGSQLLRHETPKIAPSFTRWGFYLDN